jgi:hypothetical protein
MDWATDKRGHPKLVDVAISFEWKVESEKDLEPMLEISGFDTYGEWVTEFYRLNPKVKAVKGYLYLVVNMNLRSEHQRAIRGLRGKRRGASSSSRPSQDR